MIKNNTLGNRCRFKTKRLLITSWQLYINSPNKRVALANKVINLLSPQVTEALPKGWQAIDIQEKALNWIKERDDESSVFLIELLSSEEIIGFLFLNEIFNIKNKFSELKIGYLFSEKFWGKGFGSELIGGLVEWSKMDGNIKMISGGVEKNNIASFKILKKNGFIVSKLTKTSQNMIFSERLI